MQSDCPSVYHPGLTSEESEIRSDTGCRLTNAAVIVRYVVKMNERAWNGIFPFSWVSFSSSTLTSVHFCRPSRNLLPDSKRSELWLCRVLHFVFPKVFLWQKILPAYIKFAQPFAVKATPAYLSLAKERSDNRRQQMQSPQEKPCFSFSLFPKRFQVFEFDRIFDLA